MIALPARLVSTIDTVLAALAPRWQGTLVLFSAFFLYQATVEGGAGHGQIPAWRGLFCVGYGVLAFGALWFAMQPIQPAWTQASLKRLPEFARWRIWRAALTLALLWIPLHGFVAQLPGNLHGRYHNDAVAFVHADADLLRHGRNPFTADDAFWSAAVRWPDAYATPLLGSLAFGSDPLRYPSSAAQGAALHDALAHPALRNAGNFDPRTVHNYPAGIIWLALPLIWAGLPSITWLSFAALIALGALLWQAAPAGMRAGALIIFLANPVMWLYSLLENYDVICIVFIVAAWQFLPRTRLSPALLGIACAVKQIAWFFAPFYLVEIFRREGWRAAVQRGGWLALGFIVPNLPFILLSPGAWLHSLLAPQTDAMFPIGYGLISLGLGGLAPVASSHLWSALEGIALVALLLFQLRRRLVISDGIVLALIPLWFAWRSPMNYFAFLPVLALWLMVHTMSEEKQMGQRQPPSAQLASDAS